MKNMICDYGKDEIIFREGDLDFCMYELLQGSVGIYVDYGKPDEKLLTQLSASDRACFGEMGLIDELPRSATAVALDRVRVYRITHEGFGQYFRDNPDAVLQIMQNMSQRIRGLTDDYLNVCRTVMQASEDAGGKNVRLRQELSSLADRYRASAVRKTNSAPKT